MFSIIESVCSNCTAIIVAIVTVLVLVILKLGDSRVFDAKGKRIPGPDSNLWGKNVLTVARRGRTQKQISKVVYEEFLPLGDGNIVSYVYFGMAQAVMIGHPDMAKVVLSGHHTKFPKPHRYERLRFILGDGLVMSKGAKWQSHRHAINLAFHAEALKGMVPLFSQHVNKQINLWHTACKTNGSTVVNFGKFLTDLTLSIICQCAFGFDISASQSVFEAASINFDLLSNEMNSRLSDPTTWWQNLFPSRLKATKASTEYFKKFIGTIINERLERRNSKTSKGNDETPTDLLDILLTASETLTSSNEAKLTESDLYDHIMTFLFAGHETTASTIMWIIHELCINSDVQRKCQVEVDNAKVSDIVSYEELNKFTYLSQVMKETLRLHPTAGMIGRVTTDGCTLGEYELRPNTTIMISTFCVHRHPDFWEQPEVFQPDRFSAENARKTIKHPFQYIPFSAGPRNCIGQRFSQMETIVLLTRLLNEFTFSFTEEARKAIIFEEMLTSHPSNMFVTVTPRNK